VVFLGVPGKPMPALLYSAVYNMARQANVPLLVAGATVFAVAYVVLAATRRLSRGNGGLRAINESAVALPYAAVVLAVAYTVVYTYLSIHRYYKLMCGGYDFGIFESLFANALQGHFFQDYRGPFDHFEPTLAVFLPFYALWHDPRTLFALQSFAIALAAWPLYLLAKEVSGRTSVGAAIAIAYLLYPFVGAKNLYDFHGIAITPLVFFFMLLFMQRRRWGLYWLFFALLLLVKESEIILSFGVGLYLLSKKDYIRGAVTAAVSVGWFFVVTEAILPWITGASFLHYHRYEGLGEIVGAAFSTREGAIAAAAYVSRVFAVFCFAAMPLSFLFFRRWRAVILIFGPAFAVNMISKNLYQNVLFGHYAITVAAAALGAVALSLDGLKGFSRQEKPSILPAFVIVVAVLSNLLLSWPANYRILYPTVHLYLDKSFNVLSMPIPYDRERLAFYGQDEHERFFTDIVELFPKGSSIATQNNLAYFFVTDHKVYDLKFMPQDTVADYYLFDAGRGDYMQTPPETFKFYLDRLAADPKRVKFLDLSAPGRPDFVFYATDGKWTDFYDNARKAHERDPGNASYVEAMQAVERTMGLR
jgi:uncharacterized membrane protein